MATKLFLRATTNNGVSGYKDMLTTAGSSVKSVTSNTTTSSGTEIAFPTGIWISGYTPAGGFTLTNTDVSVWQLESNMNANVGGRYRVYKRTLDGTETEIGGGPFNDGVEMNTSIREDTWAGDVTNTAFAVNDRIVVKFFATNVGTMASGFTADIQYDAADTTTGDSFFNIAETVSFTTSPTLPTFSQTAYRFYEDGTETGSTAIDSQNTNISRDVSSDSNLQLRIRLQETNAVAGDSTDDYQLQYELNDSGTYVAVDSSAGVDFYPESNQSSQYGSRVDFQPKTGQSFTGNGDAINTVTLYLRKTGSATGNLVAYIYAHTGSFGSTGVPTGSPLATSNTIDISTLSTSFALVDFTFSSPYTTSNGTKYFVVLEYDGGDASNQLNVGLDSTSPTHAGNAVIEEVGIGWIYDNTRDCIFYINRVTPVISFNSSFLTDGNATTNRLGSGSGSFVAGEISEDGLVDNLQITASNYTELLYSLTLVSAELDDADTIDFRVLRNGATTGLTYTVTPRITVDNGSGGNVNVEPAVLTLNLSTQAPTITAQRFVTVMATVLTLAASVISPGVTAIRNVSTTPNVLGATLSTQGTTVLLGANIVPSVLSSTFSVQAPTISAIRHVNVTPNVLSLSASIQTPTVTSVRNVSTNANVQTITASTQAPTVSIGVTVTPAVGTLTASTQTPTVTAIRNVTIEPAVRSVVASIQAPTVSTVRNVTVEPNSLSLNATVQAPVVSAIRNITVEPNVLSLTASLQAPTVLAIRNVTIEPSPLLLTASVQAPTVSTAGSAFVEANVLTLAASIQAPAVTAIRNVTVQPNSLGLTATTQAPTISAIRNVTVSANPLSLTSNVLAPTVSTVRNVNYEANVLNQVISIQSPTVTAIRNVQIAPNPLNGTFSIQAPTVTAIRNVTVTPAVQTITSSLQSHTVSAVRNVTITAAVQTLTATLLAPTVTSSLDVTISASVQSIALTQLNVVVTTVRNVSLEAGVQQLNASVQAPAVVAIRHVTVMVDTLELSAEILEVEVEAFIGGTSVHRTTLTQKDSHLLLAQKGTRLMLTREEEGLRLGQKSSRTGLRQRDT